MRDREVMISYPSMCLLGTSFTLKMPYTGLYEDNIMHFTANLEGLSHQLYATGLPVV